MATQTDAELQQQYAAWAKVVSSSTSTFNSLNDVMDDYDLEQERGLKAYSKRLDRLGAFDKAENSYIKSQLMKLKQYQTMKQKEFDEQDSMRKKLIEQHRQILAGQNQKMTAEQVELKLMKENNSSYAQISEKLKPLAKDLGDIQEKMSEQEKELAKVDWGSAFSNAIQKMFSPAMFAEGGKEIINSLQAQINTGISLSKVTYAQMASLGMKPTEFAQAMKQYRGAALAAGGLTRTVGILNKAEGEYTSSIADRRERTEFMLKQMDTLRKSGIKPLQSDTVLLQHSFLGLQKMAGLTGADFQNMMSEMQDSDETMRALRATSSESERRAILTGIATRVQENVAMGMTIEQAKRATLALSKLAGQTPLERIRQAAKLRAFGGAMGVGGGDEAAKALIAGQRATKEQKDSLQKYLSESSNALSQSAMGPMGGEIFATSLADKLGINQLIGPGSDFNTVLTKDLAGTMQAAAGSLGNVDKAFVTANDWYQKIFQYGLMANPLLLMIAGATSWLAYKSPFGQKGMDWIKGKGGGKGGAAGIMEEAGEAAGGASKLAKLAPMLKGLGVLGAVGGGVAAGYGDFMAGKRGKGIGEGVGTAAGGWGGAAGGAALGTMLLPGIGTIAGGLIGGALGAWGGGEAGGMAGGMFDSDSGKEAKDASVATADGISQQIKQMDDSNNYLKTLVDNTSMQNDITGKLLAAMTMSSDERTEFATSLRMNSKFANSYVSSPG